MKERIPITIVYVGVQVMVTTGTSKQKLFL